MTISLKFLIDAAEERGWRIERIDTDRGFAIFYPPSETPIVVRNSITELSTAVGFATATYKYTSQLFAEKVGFKIPRSVAVTDDITEALKLLQELKRVVVKPMDAAHGEAVYTNIKTEEELRSAIKHAHAANVKSWSVIVQEYCPGNDYRLIVLENKVIASIERVPFTIMGDGKHSIAELVHDRFEQLMARPDNKILGMKLYEEEVFNALKPREPSQVPVKDEKITAQGVANLSRGGEATDMSGQIHPRIEGMAAELAQMLGLGFCAIDVLSQDISGDPDHSRTIFVEANVSPGFRGHYYPQSGQIRDIAGQVLDAIIQRRNKQKLLQKSTKDVNIKSS